MKRPIDYTERLTRDVWCVVTFCIRRRSRHRDVWAACRRVLLEADLTAVEFLLNAIETRGVWGPSENRILHRLRPALEDDAQRRQLRLRLKGDTHESKAPTRSAPADLQQS